MVMQGRTRQELYSAFLDFVRAENQLERNAVNRRMLNVFLWCLVLPLLCATILVLLVNLHWLPRSFRGYLDPILLIFPVFYSLYFFGWHVLKDIPQAFRRGGVASILEKARDEGAWRERVCAGLTRTLGGTTLEEWRWIATSFEKDLESVQYRNRYLTVLSGAVFYLLMQGIDILAGEEGHSVWVKHPVFGWVETASNDFSQFIGLGLFLVLLYLSGSQLRTILQRYLNCVDLLKN